MQPASCGWRKLPVRACPLLRRPVCLQRWPALLLTVLVVRNLVTTLYKVSSKFPLYNW